MHMPCRKRDKAYADLSPLRSLDIIGSCEK
jgi:hypothetical protein